MEKNFNGHEYVDLGLPSGRIWAKCNVGAKTETESGMYFQWGDINDFINKYVPFLWDGYKFGTGDNLTKYNSEDCKIVLDLEDDAAHFNMGGDWRMPTKEDFEELLNNTDYKYTTINGINGCIFISKNNSNKLFFPATGNKIKACNSSFNLMGEYFSSTLEEGYLYSAYHLHFGSTKIKIGTYSRNFACCVRGVI